MKVKENKGITLIALIITIVILLILAVVTIMAVNGDGIISKAKQAKTEYENVQLEEQNVLDKYLAEMEGILGNNSTGGNGTMPGETPVEDNRQEYTIGEIRTENGTINGEEASVTNPIIPAGFQAKNTETSVWDAEGGPEVDKGLVITDGTNEFVWVPVTESISEYGIGTTNYREPDVITQEWDSSSSSYKDGADNNPTYLNIIKDILGVQYNNSDEFLSALQEDFNLMANSIKNNHGFYVGRYETSLNNGVAGSVYGATSATAEESSANRWYGLYAYQKAYSTNSVQGSMIWGSQYDRMMTWMQNTGTDVDSGIGDDKNLDRITGTKETDKINNVYDLYGNLFEWTLEASYISGRVFRGGSYGNDDAPSFSNSSYPTYPFSSYGSRLALYIK